MLPAIYFNKILLDCCPPPLTNATDSSEDVEISVLASISYIFFGSPRMLRLEF
jgi:hypothetical protein